MVYHRWRPLVLPSLSDPNPNYFALRWSTCTTYPPDWYDYPTILFNITIPTLFISSYQPCWEKAIQEEFQAFQENHIWDIIHCLSGIRPIRYKWVYFINFRSDGLFERYKTQLMALNNRQEYRMDYEETFAHIAKMAIVRTILTIVALEMVFSVDGCQERFITWWP